MFKNIGPNCRRWRAALFPNYDFISTPSGMSVSHLSFVAYAHHLSLVHQRPIDIGRPPEYLSDGSRRQETKTNEKATPSFVPTDLLLFFFFPQHISRAISRAIYSGW